MSKSVYVRVFHDLELLRYVLRCAIERQLYFPAGMNKVLLLLLLAVQRSQLSAVVLWSSESAHLYHF